MGYTAGVMERPSVTMRVGTSLTTERGAIIHVSKISKRRTPPGSTAKHEAAHIIAAQASGGIALATIIGTSEYAGATWPVVMTAMAAMAAKADGHDGYGWDEFMTQFILGVNPNAAASSAASYLASRHDYMYVVASKLQEKGTIGQGEVDEAYREVDDEKAGNWDVAIHLRSKEGQTNIYMRRSRNNEVAVPLEEVKDKDQKEEKKDAHSAQENGKDKTSLAA